MYVYSILVGIFTLGLPKAYSYFVPRAPLSQAKSIIKKITNIFYVLGIIMSLSLLGGAEIIALVMKNPELAPMLRVFSPVPFFLLPTLGVQSILVTFNKSALISLYVIITNVANLLFVVLPVIIWDYGCREALLGFNLGSFIAFITALILKYNPIKDQSNEPTKESYKAIFKFTIPLFIATIWGTLINATDQFFISRYFGIDTFAYFSNGAMELPFVGMVVGATSAVLTPLFARGIGNNVNIREEILPIWNNAFKKSAMLIYPITVFCIFFSTDIMTLMYGEIYAPSGDFFRIKLLTYFFKIIIFYSLIIALGATVFYQLVHMLQFLFLVCVEYLSIILFDNPILITGIHVLSVILQTIVFMIYIAKKMDVKLVELIPYRLLSTISLISIITCCILMVFNSFVISTQSREIVKLSIDGILFIIIYFGLCSIFKLDYISIIRPLLKK